MSFMDGEIVVQPFEMPIHTQNAFRDSFATRDVRRIKVLNRGWFDHCYKQPKDKKG